MSTKRNPTDPGEWLRRARSNLARAKADLGSADMLLEDSCFDAQQAAEKALKALLVKCQVRFGKTHDIVNLLGLLQDTGIRVPDDVLQAAELTPYAVDSRYPGLYEDVTPEEYREAVRLAERVVRWAEQILQEYR
ncbi:MAG: HEPN domain-containing protein [Ignavibacteriales bacterium]